MTCTLSTPTDHIPVVCNNGGNVKFVECMQMPQKSDYYSEKRMMTTVVKCHCVPVRACNGKRVKVAPMTTRHKASIISLTGLNNIVK